MFRLLSGIFDIVPLQRTFNCKSGGPSATLRVNELALLAAGKLRLPCLQQASCACLAAVRASRLRVNKSPALTNRGRGTHRLFGGYARATQPYGRFGVR